MKGGMQGREADCWLLNQLRLSPSAKLLASLMPEESRSRTLLWVLLGGGGFFLFLVAIFALVYFSIRSQQKDSSKGFGDKIGVVDLEGVILSPKERSSSCASLLTTTRSRPSSCTSIRRAGARPPRKRFFGK